MWASGGDKLLKVLKVVSDKISLSSGGLGKVSGLGELVELYEGMKPVESPPPCDFGSAIFPLEPVKGYGAEGFDVEEDDPASYSASRGFKVAGIDTSVYSPGPHIVLNISLVNVGYWYMDYGRRFGGDDNVAELFTDVVGSDVELRAKEVELRAIEELSQRLEGGFLLLDESLSLSYALSWDFASRKAMVDCVKLLVDVALRDGYVPVGAYHTRASDVSRGLRALTGDESVRSIPDRTLFNQVLPQCSRSPVFSVYSRALEGSGLEVACFYVKLSEGNVLRLEFPRQLVSKASEIFEAVLTQCLLGGGYPLALQRAHERAVLRSDDRRLIEGEICRKLGLPTVGYAISAKALSKRWPIA